MKCPNCDKEIAEGRMFCVYCGVQVKKTIKPLFITLFVVIVLLALGGLGYYQYDKAKQERAVMERELAETQQREQENNNKILNDKELYLILVKDGDALLANKKYSKSISKYNEALVYEQKYSGTGYASHFNSNVETKISSAKQQQESDELAKKDAENKRLLTEVDKCLEDKDKGSSEKVECTYSVKTVHNDTSETTIFVWTHFWYMFNARSYETNSSFFGIKHSSGFWTIVLVIVIGQILIVELLYNFFNVAPMFHTADWQINASGCIDWLLIVGLSSLVLWVREVFCLVSKCFRK